MSTLGKIQKAQADVTNDSDVSAILKQNSLHQIVLSERIETDGIETTRFQHYYGGIEVFGSQTMHHVGAAGVQVQNMLAKFDVSTQPSLTAATAISVAQAVIGQREPSQADLKIFPIEEGQARLVYWLKFPSQGQQAGRDMVIDAHSGEILMNMSSHISIAPVQVYDTRYTVNQRVPCQELQGGEPVQFNIQDCMQTVINSRVRQGADAPSQRALANSLKVLNFYATKFNRDSYDNRGSQIINIVHAGVRFANAFWDTETSMMAYGDGDGVQLGDMTQAVDVAAHEMSHGVTAATAKLIGGGEPGALNEANSDFFGIEVSGETRTWAIGAGVFVHPTAANFAIRDLAQPERLRSPVSLADGTTRTLPYPSSTAAEARPFRGCDDSNDECNVHYNSTIPSHAMYLMAQAVGDDVAAKIEYAALTHAMTPSTSFRQYGAAIRQVCAQLYDARTCQAVSQAYASTGL
jgi:Zn-dependent metalloprotease